MSDVPDVSGLSDAEAVITAIEVDGVRIIKLSGQVGHGDESDVEQVLDLLTELRLAG